ncbi:hypothetical protein [Citrobacter freundii]|uniref:hypothetical protein n=1 Tax=Citrobacter freundii TaxID=546 RepID=UPI00227BA704|nr:hypothetical protein [Citrobacter freundii]MCY3452687.1 hypothetical protein [Citrobacter freundii]
MQIREQGRKIQCIRTVYDKAIGRGRQTVIATLARYRGLTLSGTKTHVKGFWS